MFFHYTIISSTEFPHVYVGSFPKQWDSTESGAYQSIHRSSSCVLRVGWVFSRNFLHNFASKYEYMKSVILIKNKQNTTRNVMLKSINHSKTEHNCTVKRNLDGHSHHLKSWFNRWPHVCPWPWTLELWRERLQSCPPNVK